MPEKCTECPECGCQEAMREDAYGEGYRVCINCEQEWWTNINYAEGEDKE